MGNPLLEGIVVHIVPCEVDNRASDNSVGDRCRMKARENGRRMRSGDSVPDVVSDQGEEVEVEARAPHRGSHSLCEWVRGRGRSRRDEDQEEGESTQHGDDRLRTRRVTRSGSKGIQGSYMLSCGHDAFCWNCAPASQDGRAERSAREAWKDSISCLEPSHLDLLC